jgi:hypothetical protein
MFVIRALIDFLIGYGLYAWTNGFIVFLWATICVQYEFIGWALALLRGRIESLERQVALLSSWQAPKSQGPSVSSIVSPQPLYRSDFKRPSEYPLKDLNDFIDQNWGQGKS